MFRTCLVILAISPVLVMAACGHTVAAVSAAQARVRGAEVCHGLHANLEAQKQRASGTRLGLSHTMANAVESDTGYTNHANLSEAFVGCRRVAWSRDLGPLPSIPNWP